MSLAADWILAAAAAVSGGGGGAGPTGAPSDFGAENLGGGSDTPLTLYAKHYKNGQESAASNSASPGYTSTNVLVRCTWLNGDDTAYTRIYDSNNVLQKTASPGATTIDLRAIAA